MRRTALAVFALLLASPPTASGERLTADGLLLVVNGRVPESRRVAEYYAEKRGVPDGRILEIDVEPKDEIARDAYERDVAAAVRKWLADNDPGGTVRCVVPCYGVPLRVGSRQLTEAEQAERAEIDVLAGEVIARAKPHVDRTVSLAETIGGEVPGEFPFLSPLQTLVARIEVAERQIGPLSRQITESERATLRRQIEAELAGLSRPLDADAQRLAGADRAAFVRAVNRAEDAEQRAAARRLGRRASLFDLARVLSRQQRALDDDQSAAALDSELALVLQPAYATALWQPNPLADTLDFGGDPATRPLMVARLDTATPQGVIDLIDASVAVERDGLTGNVVVDSRGLPGRGDDGGYGPFDEQLRELVALLRKSGTLPVVHDDEADVLRRRPGGRAAAEDVAVYVGWYQLRKYEPAFDFARGAVGYHVASLELMSLHSERETGWVRGLLNDGVVGTAGATAEPYLSAFPPPIEFVPLLMTGELTLAETYWATVPHASWRLALVGDPLYRPFAAAAAFDAAALPDPLRRLVE